MNVNSVTLEFFCNLVWFTIILFRVIRDSKRKKNQTDLRSSHIVKIKKNSTLHHLSENANTWRYE